MVTSIPEYVDCQGQLVVKELGIDTVKIGRAKIGTTQIKRTEPITNVGRTSYETVNMTVLRRGVIGVNKIGYVL